MGEASDKRPIIDADECTGCALCVDVCEQECLELVDDIAKVTKMDDCIGCGDCAEECPVEAVTME